MKIYAITKGTYSSYRICALTTSESKAKELQKIYTDVNLYDLFPEEAVIEEFEDSEDEEIML